MSIKYLSVIILCCAGLASASPLRIDKDVARALLKRNTAEGLHLVDCPGTDFSYCKSWMHYYTDDSTADANHVPPDLTVVRDDGECLHWEGTSTSGYYKSSGVTFTANINANAKSQPFKSRVGTGYNGSNWYCYKDNNHAIYNTKYNCQSMYYCLKF